MSHTFKLSRKKGWRMPPGSVRVDRGSKWGNPFKVGDVGVPDAASAVALFDAALLAGDLEFSVEDVIEHLKDRPLGCWCEIGAPCHRDSLFHFANGGKVTDFLSDARKYLSIVGLDRIPVNAMPPVDVGLRSMRTLLMACQKYAESLGLEVGFSLHESTVPRRGIEGIRQALSRLNAAVKISMVESGQPVELLEPTPPQMAEAAIFHARPLRCPMTEFSETKTSQPHRNT